MIWYRIVPPVNVLWLPVFAALAFGASFGAALWIAALMVKYRDFRFLVPFMVQFGLYISPVGFLTSVVPERWRLIYSLNPIVGAIDGFRWSILGAEHALYIPGIVTSILGVAFLLITGMWYFRKTERTFADII
jgi:lipopolysaccharide transport system permease protein